MFGECEESRVCMCARPPCVWVCAHEQRKSKKKRPRMKGKWPEGAAQEMRVFLDSPSLLFLEIFVPLPYTPLPPLRHTYVRTP